MPLLQWMTRDQDLIAADRVPYRLLDEVAELSVGQGTTCWCRATTLRPCARCCRSTRAG